jgi:hypothetical protein
MSLFPRSCVSKFCSFSLWFLPEFWSDSLPTSTSYSTTIINVWIISFFLSHIILMVILISYLVKEKQPKIEKEIHPTKFRQKSVIWRIVLSLPARNLFSSIKLKGFFLYFLLPTLFFFLSDHRHCQLVVRLAFLVTPTPPPLRYSQLQWQWICFVHILWSSFCSSIHRLKKVTRGSHQARTNNCCKTCQGKDQDVSFVFKLFLLFFIL